MNTEGNTENNKIVPVIISNDEARALIARLGFKNITEASDPYESWALRDREVDFFVNFGAEHASAYAFNVIGEGFSVAHFMELFMKSVDKQIKDMVRDIDDQWSYNYQ